ncbi:MAG: hypothetical protein AAFR47_17470 [Pseudomonadota bacterium]
MTEAKKIGRGLRGKHHSEEEVREVLTAIADHGSLTMAALSRQIGVHRDVIRRRRDELLKAGLEALLGKAAQQPHEIHDAGFWRAKFKAMEKDRNALSALNRQLGVLDGLRAGAPDWDLERSDAQSGSATLIVHNSDWHYGERIEASEVNGWNAFDVEICERRIKRFAHAATTIGRRWTSDTKVDGVLYTMGGDMISGDIHDELRETNELTSLEQVMGCARLHVSFIRSMADEYGRVHVSAVPGNHGRTTRKPTAKKYGALSYDILIARMVAKEFKGDDRVTFAIAAGPDLIELIYNRPVLVTHGDKIGTGGGKGFAGPVLPIIRGGKQVEVQYGSAGMTPYLILMGHYHTSAHPPAILANGSVPGMSEFGFGIRGKFDTPRQWLALLHSKWGLRDRLDVQLEDPIPPEKPRLRVTA